MLLKIGMFFCLHTFFPFSHCVVATGGVSWWWWKVDPTVKGQEEAVNAFPSLTWKTRLAAVVLWLSALLLCSRA